MLQTDPLPAMRSYASFRRIAAHEPSRSLSSNDILSRSKDKVVPFRQNGWRTAHDVGIIGSWLRCSWPPTTLGIDAYHLPLNRATHEPFSWTQHPRLLHPAKPFTRLTCRCG